MISITIGPIRLYVTDQNNPTMEVSVDQDLYNRYHEQIWYWCECLARKWNIHHIVFNQDRYINNFNIDAWLVYQNDGPYKNEIQQWVFNELRAKNATQMDFMFWLNKFAYYYPIPIRHVKVV
jgi:hypothetical protein